MDDRDPPQRASTCAAELADQVEQEFPGLFFDWTMRGDALYVETLSRNGTRLRARIGRPTTGDRIRAAAQRHIDDDTARDAVADRLVSAVGGYSSSRGHLPYVLRWLILPQRAVVELGDHPDVSPVVASPCIALVRTSGARLKLWADGTAVMHHNNFSPDRSTWREPQGMDLTRVNLGEFQAMWLPPSIPTAHATVEAALTNLHPDSAEAAALGLLRAYDDGAWLHHHRFIDDVADHTAPHTINWAVANRLSTIDTEATVQDRAILAVACHLSGDVDPLVSLPDALHHIGTGRQPVLEVIAHVAGSHPNPDAGWPVDCPACP